MSRERPPIEPLSDVSWQRVEKKLFAQLDLDNAVGEPAPVRRRMWQPWALAGGLALACTAAALLLLRPTDTRSIAAADDAGPGAPARVVTQESASEITFGEATITVDAETAVTMYGDADRGVMVLLERGRATFHVAPRGDRPPFMVQAGEVTVRVIGTRFTVSRSGDAARVDVIEGHVEVVARGHRVQVRAGESWSSDGDREAVIRDPATSQSGIAAAPFMPAQSDGPRGRGGNDSLPLGGRQVVGDRFSGDGEPSEGLPWEGQSSAGAATVTPDSGTRESADQDPTARPRPRQRSSHSIDADIRTRYERAAALEASDARGALAAYRDLAKGSSKWAQNSLYAAGRLAADLGDEALAARLLRRYVKRFPRGANADDAKALLQSLE